MRVAAHAVLRRQASGNFALPLSAAEAIGYFTPEGEREWVPGWDPQYPAGERVETPGTVFITGHGDEEIIWTIQVIDREHRRAAYTRHSVGRWAGAVAVRCEDLGPGRCQVAVDYDTTVLPGGDPAILAQFAEEPYRAMMREWAAAVRAVL